MVMEDGGTARLRPTLMRLTADEAHAVAAETGRLFAALHSRRVFHTDLKPGNLLLRPAGGAGGRIVLIDCDQVWFRRPITLALRRRNLGQFLGDRAASWLSPELSSAFLEGYLGALPGGLRPALKRVLAAAPLG
jgi:serine/threonine protein kinase